MDCGEGAATRALEGGKKGHQAKRTAGKEELEGTKLKLMGKERA